MKASHGSLGNSVVHGLLAACALATAGCSLLFEAKPEHAADAGSGPSDAAPDSRADADTPVPTLDASPGDLGPIYVQSSDDAHQATGTDVPDLSASVLPLSTETIVGLRFVDLAIPGGTEVRSAYLQFTASETSAGGATINIHVENSIAAPAFLAEVNNLQNRPVLDAVAVS